MIIKGTFETSTVTGIGTIKSPADVVYAFLPNIVSISNCPNSTVKIAIYSAGKTIATYNCVVKDGIVKQDISAAVQAMFDRDTIFDKRSVDYYVRVTSGSATANMSAVVAIWGAPMLGQKAWGTRRVRWNTKAPFKVSLFMDDHETLYFKENLDNRYFEDASSVSGFNDINPMTYTDGNDDFALKTVPDDQQPEGVFDGSFDTTFRDIEDTVRVYLYRYDCDGITMRWIDNMGFLQYWTFDKMSDTLKFKASGDSLRSMVNINGFNHYVYSNESKTGSATISVGSAFVTKDEYEYLSTITTALCIQMFKGYDSGNEVWVPVTLKTESLKHSGESLADVSLDFEIETLKLQSL